MKLSSRSLSGLGLRLLLLKLRFTIMLGADYFHVIYCTLAISREQDNDIPSIPSTSRENR